MGCSQLSNLLYCGKTCLLWLEFLLRETPSSGRGRCGGTGTYAGEEPRVLSSQSMLLCLPQVTFPCRGMGPLGDAG